MKKNITIGVLGFAVCTASTFPKNELIDYRDPFVGTYFCKVTCNSLSDSPTQKNYSNDTISIIVSKGAKDSSLNINLKNKILKVKLINKNIKAYDAGVRCGGNFFATDSLDFGFAPGLASSCRYKGKKISLL